MSYSRRKSTPDWSVDSIVKVGFQTLRVLGVYPDGARRLESLDGNRKYAFEPYRGLFRVY